MTNVNIFTCEIKELTCCEHLFVPWVLIWKVSETTRGWLQCHKVKCRRSKGCLCRTAVWRSILTIRWLQTRCVIYNVNVTFFSESPGNNSGLMPLRCTALHFLGVVRSVWEAFQQEWQASTHKHKILMRNFFQNPHKHSAVEFLLPFDNGSKHSTTQQPSRSLWVYWDLIWMKTKFFICFSPSLEKDLLWKGKKKTQKPKIQSLWFELVTDKDTSESAAQHFATLHLQ